MKISIERTKRDCPALWEWGGGYTNTGEAQIVCGPNGEPLKPVYVRRRGSLANGNHALFIVRPGCYVVRAEHHRGDFAIDVLKIKNINSEEAEAEVELAYQFDQGDWDVEPPEFLQGAIEAVCEKARCYHCRWPHYVATDDKWLPCPQSALSKRLWS